MKNTVMVRLPLLIVDGEVNANGFLHKGLDEAVKSYTDEMSKFGCGFISINNENTSKFIIDPKDIIGRYSLSVNPGETEMDCYIDEKYLKEGNRYAIQFCAIGEIPEERIDKVVLIDRVTKCILIDLENPSFSSYKKTIDSRKRGDNKND